MPDKLSSGFPYPLGGGKYLSIIDHQGPASYTQVTTGTPPSGGDQISAQMFGLKWLDAVWVEGADATGAYLVVPVDLANLNHTFAILRWFALSTTTPGVGAEVSGNSTALASLHIRVCAIGH
jgi:hypothetical protein